MTGFSVFLAESTFWFAKASDFFLKHIYYFAYLRTTKHKSFPIFWEDNALSHQTSQLHSLLSFAFLNSRAFTGKYGEELAIIHLQYHWFWQLSTQEEETEEHDRLLFRDCN